MAARRRTAAATPTSPHSSAVRESDGKTTMVSKRYRSIKKAQFTPTKTVHKSGDRTTNGT
jgi:hypothetical protein